MKRSPLPPRRTPLPQATKPLPRGAPPKRGKPPAAKTALQRRTQLKPGRSRLAGGAALQRSARVRPMSDKTAGRMAERKAVRLETLQRAGFRCELATIVPEVECNLWLGLEVDEKAGRGVAPGSQYDVTVTQATCRAHHEWKGANRREAEARGIRMSGAEYERRRRDRPGE